MKKLPVLISLPHAGLGIPEELEELHRLTVDEIEADGDGGAREIYDVADEVAGFVTTPIARAFVDVNRAEDDIRMDGVIKTHTCWGVPIYKAPLPDDLVQRLIEKYHHPYHLALEEEYDRKILLGIDCHTMADTGPPVGPDAGETRPLICLSDGDGVCPAEIFTRFARCLADSFQEPVSMNKPFRGGHIVKSHGNKHSWLQLEISRTTKLSNDIKREKIFESLTRFCK